MIALKNFTSMQATVHSADGDAIAIMPNTTVVTDDKFAWQIDTNKVRLVERNVADPRLVSVQPSNLSAMNNRNVSQAVAQHVSKANHR